MQVIVYMAFVFLIILICINDFTYYKISNVHVMCIGILYVIAYCTGALPDRQIWLTFNYACVCFTLLFILNQMNYIGGGDVKLVFALIFWVGSQRIKEYILVVSLIGVAMTVLYIAAWEPILRLRKAISSKFIISPIVKRFITKQRVYTVRAENFFQYEIPYGIPLALGAMCIVFSYRC